MKIDQVIKKLDLATIADRMDLPIRTLRYVIDHRLVVGLRVEYAGRGNARWLSLFDATVLACAAALLEAGCHQSRVRQMLCQYRGAIRTPQRQSFWQGLQRGMTYWNFGTSFVQVELAVTSIHSLLKGQDSWTES